MDKTTYMPGIQALYGGGKSSAKIALMSGEVPMPKSDEEAKDLLQRSKAAFDANQDDPNLQQHIDAVALALHKFHDAHPSALSRKIVVAIHSDPKIKIAHPMPKI